MFVKFITSKLLRVIVCAAAGLYGLYNAISCFVTLYKAGHQPYLMAGAVRFDFQGYYMMAAMQRRHLPAFGGAGVALPQGNEKTAGKDCSPVNLHFFCNVFPLCALLG
jgi:hypothetical protein